MEVSVSKCKDVLSCYFMIVTIFCVVERNNKCEVLLLGARDWYLVFVNVNECS